MDYRYILIDKQEKTVEMIMSESCGAATEKKQMERFGIESCWDFRTRFSMVWNNQDVDFARLPKKYQKYKYL